MNDPELTQRPLLRAPSPRVAFVSYFFPPLGGVATARATSFVRDLPSFGWEPVVIAPLGSAYPLRDEPAVSSLPTGLEVHRAPSPEPAHLSLVLRQAVVAGRRIARAASHDPSSGRGAAATPPATAVRTGPDGGSRTPAQATMASRVRKAAWFPDDQAGWLPFAVIAIVVAHRRRPFDVLLSSSSPVTAHAVAMIASRLLGIPWVADFRDPWLDNPIEPPPGRVDRWRRATLEHAIVRMAARCTFATGSLHASFASRYPRLADRFSVLPNGYGRLETADLVRKTAGTGAIRQLVYAGSLYRPEELETFLAGLRELAGRRSDLAHRLHVTFLGTATSTCTAVARRWLDDPLLADLVEFKGYVPRTVALQAIAQADGALTLLGSGPGMEMFVGVKLYDYLALDRQVVAVVPPGDARAILEDLDWGIVADPDPLSVAAGLERFVDEPLPPGPADPERRYERTAIARRLGSLLDDVISRARS